jgi:Flp pilus assembly protein TadG
MLETALMITILLMLMLGIVDMGRALFTANNLVSAAREGARYAAVDPAVQMGTDTTKQVVIQHFSQFGGGPMLASYITVLKIIDPATGQYGAVRVTIAYPFKWITPIRRLVWQDTASTTTLHAQAEYRYEF